MCCVWENWRCLMIVKWSSCNGNEETGQAVNGARGLQPSIDRCGHYVVALARLGRTLRNLAAWAGRHRRSRRSLSPIESVIVKKWWRMWRPSVVGAVFDDRPTEFGSFFCCCCFLHHRGRNWIGNMFNDTPKKNAVEMKKPAERDRTWFPPICVRGHSVKPS